MARHHAGVSGDGDLHPGNSAVAATRAGDAELVRARPAISESLGVMPRESGASSNHRVMCWAPAEITWLLDRPLSRAMTSFEAFILGQGLIQLSGNPALRSPSKQRITGDASLHPDVRFANRAGVFIILFANVRTEIRSA